MSKVKKIVVASGKGGVGKSMIASCLSFFFAKKGKLVAVDGDVDTPNLGLWLGEREWDGKEDLFLSEKPVFKECGECGECADKCRFGALSFNGERLEVNKFLCEGCGACLIFCPEGVKEMRKVKNGEIRKRKTRHGFPLLAGALVPGETGSGKIVDDLMRRGEEVFGEGVLVVDSAPGTGCPVISALKEAHFCVLVAEPTPASFSKLKRTKEVADHFGVPFGVVVNKWGLLPFGEKIKDWSGERFLGKVGYDERIYGAVSKLQPVFETNLPVKREVEKVFEKVRKMLE